MSVQETTERILQMAVNPRGFVAEDDRSAVFLKVRARPENKLCFDCPKRNPTWVCCTMGIMLCLDCSGRHRRMGTHISFVRSSDLDQFTPAQLLRVNVGGNGRARRHFQEKGLTGDIDYTSPIVTAYNAMLADEVDRILSSVTPKRVPITVTAPIATTKPVVPAVASPAVQQIKPASSPRVSPASKSSAASPVRGQKLMDFDFDLDNFEPTFAPPKPAPVAPVVAPVESRRVEEVKVYELGPGRSNPQATVALDPKFHTAKHISSADIHGKNSPTEAFRNDFSSASAISSDMYFGRQSSATETDVQLQNLAEQGRQMVEAAAGEAKVLANRAFEWFQQTFI